MKKQDQQYPRLSFWEREVFFNNIDVAVIGSGIVGLSAALSLKELDPSLRVVVLERGALPMGASTRNAGFACFGSMSELLEDVDNVGESEVFELVERRFRGLRQLRQRVGDAALDYQPNGGFELFRDDDDAAASNFERCADQLSHFNQQIKNITGEAETYKIDREAVNKFGFRHISHVIYNACEGQLHPGKMVTALAQMAREKGIELINGIDILKMNDDGNAVQLETQQGWEIFCRKILVTTNGFARQLLPQLDVYPARNQVVITKPIPNLNIKGCFHYDRGYYYFRNIDNRILLGGGRNLAAEEEKTDRFGINNFIQSALSQLLRTVILPRQSFEVDSWWSGILGLGTVKKPIVEQVSPNVCVSVRMGGMGIAIGTLAGEEGAKLVLGSKKNP